MSGKLPSRLQPTNSSSVSMAPPQTPSGTIAVGIFRLFQRAGSDLMSKQANSWEGRESPRPSSKQPVSLRSNPSIEDSRTILQQESGFLLTMEPPYRPWNADLCNCERNRLSLLLNITNLILISSSVMVKALLFSGSLWTSGLGWEPPSLMLPDYSEYVFVFLSFCIVMMCLHVSVPTTMIPG